MDRPRTLLLVEDETFLRSLVAQFLRGEGFRVIEAADGRQAIETFPARGPFDLVLLDLNLPYVSGLEVCRRIRRWRPDQPVLIVSAAILPEHDRDLAVLGVAEQLTKPYHPEALLERIDRLVPTAGRPRAAAPALALGRAVE
jgi:DNA-binding response OmpR family regulator